MNRLKPVIMSVAAVGLLLTLNSASAKVQGLAIPKPPIKSVVTQATSAKRLDLNHVDASTLAKQIKGIGKKRAIAIVAYRHDKGPFKNFNELANVRGISKRFIEKNLPYLQSKLEIK